MTFKRNRRAGRTGGNPGLTPIDDITDGTGSLIWTLTAIQGRLPSQDEMDERGAKRRPSSGKGRNKKTS